MTSTSFRSPQPSCQELFHTPPAEALTGAERDAASRDPFIASTTHAVETQRLKAFVHQRKFQAPVADDFSRGMQVEQKRAHADSSSLKNTGLLNGLAAWWRKQKAS